MREIFEVLQRELSTSKHKIGEINVGTIQEVATNIGTLIKWTADIRGNNAKIQTFSEKIDEGLDVIRSALKDYQHKLKSAVVGVPTDNSGKIGDAQIE